MGDINQKIPITFPESVNDLYITSLITYFAGFQISGNVTSELLMAQHVTFSCLDEFQALTPTQKTIVKNWEKMKIAKAYNEALEAWLGEGNFTPLTYNDIPDSFFDENPE